MVHAGKTRDGRVPRILLVDGAPDRAEMLAERLADRGMAVVVSRSGEKALLELGFVSRRTLPDLVVTAMELSGMDGEELAARLGRDARLREITVIRYRADGSEPRPHGVYRAEEVPDAVEEALTAIRACGARAGSDEPQ